MASWIALSATRHRQARFLSRTDFHFCTNRLAIPVLLSELRPLLPHMVLGVQVGEGGGCTPVALLALARGEPLYVGEDGTWQLPYVPAMLRAYPFAVGGTEQGPRAVCLHESHLSEEEGTPLFNADGSFSEPVAQTVAFLERREQGQYQARAAAERLYAADVLLPWPLKIQSQDGATHPYALEGLHRVNESALNALAAPAYHALKGGPMALAHAQLFSMGQRDLLARRAAERAAASTAVPEDLEALFGQPDDRFFDFDG